ncbi:MAG: hypothetical protein J2P21_32515 [Chloracidobacterium sp.]|nr:hypothetical protein [Chloracidobacterium sp.]
MDMIAPFVRTPEQIVVEMVIVQEVVYTPTAGLDLPGLDIVSAAKCFGCVGVLSKTMEKIKGTFGDALSADVPT